MSINLSKRTNPFAGIGRARPLGAPRRTDGPARLRSACFGEAFHPPQAATEPWRSGAVRPYHDAKIRGRAGYSARLLSAGLVLLGASQALAQVTTGARPGGTGAGIGGGIGGVTSGGGAGSNASATRQYTNSTMLGDALITSDMDSRSLIVVTDDQTFEVIKTIVAGLDQPRPQVLIDCVFVQVTHTNELDLGAELSTSAPTGSAGIGLNATGTTATQFGLGGASGLINQVPAVGSTPSPASPSSNGAFYTLTGGSVNATIHALAANNKTEVLSRPTILTRSNQQATILVGQQLPLVTGFTPITVGNTTTFENTVVQTDIGISLKVTPFITAEGNVEMILDPEISSLSSDTVAIGNGVNSPVINLISADTVVVTPNNQTVVIGGLMSTQTTQVENKMPLLGDIPLLGYAFKYKTKNKQKTELIVFMTPHIVRSPDDLSRLAKQENARLDMTPKAFERNELNKYIGTQEPVGLRPPCS
jgi:general secretion pathway protein D